jgi:succinate dehydrogenase/fumarate reductase flavoprotein subunit
MGGTVIVIGAGLAGMVAAYAAQWEFDIFIYKN